MLSHVIIALSTELALCNCWLFPKVKMTMKCKRFELAQVTEAAGTAQQSYSQERPPRAASRVAGVVG
ncbi:hypothetical protein H920_18735 [Fukomys damarensis]|uniref:Uncharacterized protein n=1 Tax=Fukomys damarensis TaxID=885580 RepID=A0A091CQE2_FUKDA|nr:hypothetical protein H920_18735 [Fukomys damarensis]